MKKVREGYKIYEFGEIPNDWEIKKIGDIFNDLRAGSTPSRKIEDYYTGDIPWITSGELKYKIIYDTLEKITEDAVKDTNLELYPEGTFFIAITGLEAAGTRGSCAISGVKATTNQSCMAFKPKDKFSNTYLYHWYRLYGDYIGLKYTQGTKQQSLNNKIVAGLEIPVPKLEEQEKIASILSTVDEQIDNVDELIQKNKELKKGLMQQLLTKGIGHTKFKKTEIGEIPEGWEVKRLEEICEDITIGMVKTMTKYYVNDGIPLIRNSDIKENYIKIDNMVYLDKQFSMENQNKCLKVGQIVTVHTGDIGTSAVIEENMKGAHGFATLNTTVNKYIVDEYYLCWYLNSDICKNQAYSFSTGDGRNNLNLKDFINILAIVPSSIEEQKKIVFILDSVSNKIKEYENKKQKLEELKKGLMQQLLTGKIRVI